MTYFKEDAWILRRIFELSDRALFHTLNRLFRTEYAEGEYIQKEWNEQGDRVCLTVGCANRYEFQIRHLDGCIEICAEDRGCPFHYADAKEQSVVQIREPKMIYFGKNTRKEFCTTLEFSGYERIVLPIHTITLADCSVRRLEEAGLILFLPFLFYCFAEETEKAEGSEKKQESLKKFILHDIVGTLQSSAQKGELTIYDVQKLKQCCRHMIWSLLTRRNWMQDLELQELVLDALEPDMGLLERTHQMELLRVRNKYTVNGSH